jgi:hypothetical protein
MHEKLIIHVSNLLVTTEAQTLHLFSSTKTMNAKRETRTTGDGDEYVAARESRPAL